MLVTLRRLLGISLASSGLAGLATGFLLAANPGAAASRYTDLRRIEPIHGDVAAGERKAAVCHACHGVGAPVAPTFCGADADGRNCGKRTGSGGQQRGGIVSRGRFCARNFDIHRSIRGLPLAARAVLDVSRRAADELSQQSAA
jgi:hypothetical protein